MTNPAKIRSGFLFALFFLPLVLGPRAVFADIMNLFLELNYNTVDTTSKDESGNSTQLRQRSFSQRYNLDLNLQPYPFVKVLAGGLLSIGDTTSRTDSSETKSRLTTTRPRIDVALTSPFLTFSAGYSRKEDTATATGIPSSSLISEEYHSLLSWRPEDLPTVAVRYTRMYFYDVKHLIQDTVDDTILLSSRYSPAKTLNLGYQITYDDFKNQLSELEIRSLLQNGQVDYADLFFDKRVSLSTSYNISHQNIDISTSGKGVVSFQVFPFAGLSSITDTPQTGALSQNALLINNNVTDNAGIDIGSAPSLTGDTRLRNIGLDFGTVMEVNELYLWITVPTVPDLFPLNSTTTTVVNSFTWDVYISSDNLNWTLWPGASAVFGSTFQSRFDITFPNVKTRYIKVVTRPLALAADPTAQYRDIYVTEFQAFLQSPAGSVKGEISSTTQIYNLNVRARIVDNLYYDLNYFYTNTENIISSTRWSLSNGLSAFHTFSRVFSGSARVAREDDYDPVNGSEYIYSYNGTLTATPLKTLRHTLAYNGQTAETRAGRRTSDFLTLTNTADLYRGITLSVGGGAGVNRSETGQKNETTNLLASADIIPNRKFTLNLNYSVQRTKQTGGGFPISSSTFEQEGVSAGFRPFTTLYLTGSVTRVSQGTARPYTTTSYGLNWTLLSGGALMFNFNHAEVFRTDINAKERTTTPSLLWKVTRSATLEVSYITLTSESNLGSTESESWNVTFRMYL